MNKVREIRESKYLSQRELSTLAKVSYTTIVRIEGGKIERPQWKTIRDIAHALGVEPDRLECRKKE